eukprot:UN05827
MDGLNRERNRDYGKDVHSSPPTTTTTAATTTIQKLQRNTSLLTNPYRNNSIQILEVLIYQ